MFALFQTAIAAWHWKKRWLQSSGTPGHAGQSAESMMDLRCRFAREFSLFSMTSLVKILTLFGALDDQMTSQSDSESGSWRY
jgi:hypothetical protein